MDKHINSNFIIICDAQVNANVIKRIFTEYENVEVVIASIYDYEFISKRYDLILDSPVFEEYAVSGN